jgi:vacuolar-type H+-ATPase subunit F/Vma7
MARLMIVTTTDLAPGYRLAGASVIAAKDGEQAAEEVRRLAQESDVAIIGVHEPYLQSFDAQLERALERRTLPVVVGIPTGEADERDGRRARLAELLRRAIGHRIVFRREDAT